MAKRVIRKCFWCKRLHTKSFTTQQQGILPSDRTIVKRPFQVIGTDFAGSIMYCNKNRGEKKTYILLFACSLTRVIRLKLLSDQTTDEFIRVLMSLIIRRGCLKTIYSENARTCVQMDQEDQQIRNSSSPS